MTTAFKETTRCNPNSWINVYTNWIWQR